MLSILIVDDTPEKIQALRTVIGELDRTEVSVKTVNDVKSALIELGNQQYDLLLLDMLIPFEWGQDSNPKYAIDLLHQLSEDEELNYPLSVLAITKLEDLKPEYKSELEQMTIALLRFAENNDSWKPQLRNKINSLLGVKRSLYSRCDYGYDVAIINALQEPEFSQLQTVFGGEWKMVKVPGDDSNNYYECTLKSVNGYSIRCVATYANQMASTASSMLTTKVIYNFRPKYLFMTGISAGTDPKDMNYGDVLVASEIWDGASGKIKTIKENTSVFMPDYRQKSLNSSFLSIVQRLKMNQELLNKIAISFPSGNGKPNTMLSIHIGPMASVPAVLSCKDEIEKIQSHSRKLQGIEMETYGMFYAAANAIHPLPKFTASLKSISDFADTEKDNDYQEYASYTSAAILKHILINELDYSR